jgi:two-component system invasion response regulator UvrY
VKFLVADDHPVVRRGVRQILADDYPDSTVIEAHNAVEALTLVQSTHVDLAIIDISLPDRNGLELLKELKKVAPHLPVIVLSMHQDEEFAIQALRFGALGYVTKESASEDLSVAVQNGLAGERYLSVSLAQRIALRVLEKQAEAPPTVLSDREQQVLRLLASGKTLQVIAEEMSLSVKTISTYRTRLLTKLNLHDNVDLTQYALRHDLLKF